MRKLPLIAALLVACSSPTEPVNGDADADAPVDTGGRPDGGADATSTDMAGQTDLGAPDAAVDTGQDLGIAGCDATCREMALDITLGGMTVAADRAFYGLTSPAMGSSGEWELHVEVYRGGSATCPDMSSPTPDQTVIITGMPLRAAPATLTEAEGLAVSLLDFEGALTMDIATPASGEQVTLAAYQVCQDCAGDDPNGWLALDVTAPLAGGQIDGHVFATHCGSLDAR